MSVEGVAIVARIGTITLSPTLVKIEPATGSSGGSTIRVTGSGFGTSTKDVMLVAGSTDICTSVTMVSYGVFDCVTKAEEVADATTMKLKIGGESYDCDSTATGAQCSYKQVTADSPDILTAAIAG